MVDYEPIQDFLKRVRAVGNSGGGKKELRLSFDEANRLAVNLAELLAAATRENSKDEVLQIVVDGGDFTSTSG